MENRINLSIFSTILLATILMGMIMSKYNRQRPLNQLNVLILLQAYLADTLSVINLALTLAVLIRITMGPLSRTVAELIMMLNKCVGLPSHHPHCGQLHYKVSSGGQLWSYVLPGPTQVGPSNLGSSHRSGLPS